MSLRTPQDILSEDLNGLESVLQSEIDFKQQSAVSWLPGIPKQKAIYFNEIGCVLLAGENTIALRNRFNKSISTSPENKVKQLVLPIPNESDNGFDLPQLKAVIDNIFLETNTAGYQQTRAILVMHKGVLIAEQYASGFSRITPMLGWSMTKSVINAIVGVLVKQKKLQLYQPVSVTAWSEPNDPRSTITLDQLLRMSSGLEFNESNNPIFSDLTEMLFRKQNSFAYAAAKPLQHQADSQWQYSSGSTNIITGIIRQVLGGSTTEVIAFFQQQLFRPLGITQATIEADASGNLIGSSFMYATAREWLAIGQLYLQDGIWKGKRILPQGWVAYSTTATKTAPKGQYGAHFWLNGGQHVTIANRPFPQLPGNLFYATGYKGQRLIMLPDSELVILHLGWFDEFSDQHMQALVSKIQATLNR